MLNAPSRRRPPRSLRAEYQEFIDQRIEEYKDSLRREEILAIGDDALQELAGADQFQLTEVVLRDQVDAIIRRRLRLPSFRRWRDRHVSLRAAQREPGHWGLAAHDPVALLGELLEDQEPVLVVGVADGACALFLAARGASVLGCDPDIAAIYGLENRAVVEQLGSRIECRVERFETLNPVQDTFVACVVETAALASLDAADRAALLARLQAATPAGALHAVMPGTPGRGVARLSGDALRSAYAGWIIRHPPAGGRRLSRTGFLAEKPAGDTADTSRQSDTDLAVSE
jgi:hypothetical protein